MGVFWCGHPPPSPSVLEEAASGRRHGSPSSIAQLVPSGCTGWRHLMGKYPAEHGDAPLPGVGGPGEGTRDGDEEGMREGEKAGSTRGNGPGWEGGRWLEAEHPNLVGDLPRLAVGTQGGRLWILLLPSPEVGVWCGQGHSHFSPWCAMGG